MSTNTNCGNCGHEKLEHTGEYNACEHRINGWFCTEGIHGEQCHAYRPAQIEPASDEGKVGNFERYFAMLEALEPDEKLAPLYSITGRDFACAFAESESAALTAQAAGYREALAELSGAVNAYRDAPNDPRNAGRLQAARTKTEEVLKNAK